MTKYEAGFKLKIVKQYLSGPLGLKALAAEHGVGHGTVRSWVNSYRAHGLPGLRRKSASYDEAFKLKVLKRMWREQWSERRRRRHSTYAARRILVGGHASIMLEVSTRCVAFVQAVPRP